MAKKILVVVPGHGDRSEQLIGRREAREAADYETEFVTPKRTEPAALPPSMDNAKADRPGKSQSISSWSPEYLRPSAQILAREPKHDRNKRRAVWANRASHSAILLGGQAGR